VSSKGDTIEEFVRTPSKFASILNFAMGAQPILDENPEF
jgi:hypothetical protein